MKRITNQSWFGPNSKEIKWWKRRGPITWQGWTITILFVIMYISLFYAGIFFSREWSMLFLVIICWMWLPIRIIINLTSDQPSKIRASGVSSKEISRILKEKRNSEKL